MQSKRDTNWSRKGIRLEEKYEDKGRTTLLKVVEDMQKG